MRVYIPYRENEYSYPDEMRKILDYLNEHGQLNVQGNTIERFYREFSDDKYCAGWMSVNPDLLEEFADWLSEIDL